MSEKPFPESIFPTKQKRGHAYNAVLSETNSSPGWDGSMQNSIQYLETSHRIYLVLKQTEHLEIQNAVL